MGDSGSEDDPPAVLGTELEKSLLRGTPVHRVLGCLGSSFRDNTFDERSYANSEEVDTIDDYVSHDWSSSAIRKFFALALLYNGPAAAWLSLLVAAVPAVLQHRSVGVLPLPTPVTNTGDITYYYGYWCQVVGIGVHAVLLCSWQHLRALLRWRGPCLFFDKFCIDQVNPERQKAGILGLGGFLRKTNRLVILWTPRYFTRLWCTYELAVWLHLQKPLQIIFMPLDTAAWLVKMSALTAAFTALLCLTLLFNPLSWGWWVSFFLGMAVILPFVAHSLRTHIHALRKLQANLLRFDAKKTECFCCTNNHVHPRSGRPIAHCDRKLVYYTLSRWFGEEGEPADPHVALSRFNAAVRSDFADFFLETAHPSKLPYKYLIVAVSWPWVFRGLDMLAAFGEFPTEGCLRMVLEYWANIFLVYPLLYRFGVAQSVWLDAAVGMPRGCLPNLLLDVLLAAGLLADTVVLWAPVGLLRELESPWPFCGAVLAETILACALFGRDLIGPARWISRRSSAAVQSLRSISWRATASTGSSASAPPPHALDPPLFSEGATPRLDRRAQPQPATVGAVQLGVVWV